MIKTMLTIFFITTGGNMVPGEVVSPDLHPRMYSSTEECLDVKKAFEEAIKTIPAERFKEQGMTDIIAICTPE